jgi:hypothetical protein
MPKTFCLVDTIGLVPELDLLNNCISWDTTFCPVVV